MATAINLRTVPERGPPVTLWDCAAVANAAYKDKGSVAGWTQIQHRGLGDSAGGFFGSAYRRDYDILIALRGTSDTQDIIDDASMVPFKTAAEAKIFGTKFVQEYTKKNQKEAEVVAHALEIAFKYKIIERAKWLLFSERLNQLPPSQATELDKFLYELVNKNLGYNFRIRAFVGHSLGGALAQAASENYSFGRFTLDTLTGSRMVDKRIAIPAVAFNSPYMGTISGMQRDHGPGILCVNAALDPLSVATRVAGNESHAKFIEVVQTPGIPNSVPPAHYHGEIGPFKYWFLKQLGHFHGMSLLHEAMTNGIGRKKLSMYFPCTLGIDD